MANELLDCRIKAGDIVSHFKCEWNTTDDWKNLKYCYFVLYIGRIHDTAEDDKYEDVVIYQALYGDRATYKRELNEFMSLVDKKKYPDIKREYRFEKIL